jgi:hypothetical protein
VPTAGVEPQLKRLNGGEPVAYILSSNVRRDLTQGQRAVIPALAMNLSQNVTKNRGGTEIARALKVPRQRVSEAIIIVTHAPDLGQQVKRNELPFSQAVERSRALKAEAETNAEKMARLKAEAPDLADLSGM